MHERRHIKTRGTTIIEMLLYIAIVSGLLVGIGGIAFDMFETKNKGIAIAEVNYAASRLVGEFTRRVEASRLIVQPIPGSTSTALILTTTSSSTDPTVFALNGTDLLVTTGTGTPARLLPGVIRVRSAEFMNLTPPGIGRHHTVRATFEIETGEEEGNNSYRFEKIFTVSATTRVTP
jgi:hypothetical protein